MAFTNIYNPRPEIRKMDQMRPTLLNHGATLGANRTIVLGAPPHLQGAFAKQREDAERQNMETVR
jgi:hypothetical protein